MWIVCITSVRHVLTVNGYGGRQTKENEKSWCFKGWETLVIIFIQSLWRPQVMQIMQVMQHLFPTHVRTLYKTRILH